VEEDRQRVWEEVQLALRRGERFNVRYAIRHRDGEIRHVEDQGQGVYDEEGNVEVLEGLVYDVPEFARTKERLKESETRYRTLVERMPAIVYIQAMNGRMTTLYDSPQIEAMLGYPQDRYRQDPEYWTKILHPDDRERVLAEDRRSEQTGEPLRAEFRKVRRDGRVIWVRDEAAVVRNADGRPLYWQGNFADITERRRTGYALRESEERFRQLFEQSADDIFVHDEKGRFVDCNSQAGRLLGYTREELLDLSASELLAADPRW
jgi:PAS domain S-box-containing protein